MPIQCLVNTAWRKSADFEKERIHEIKEQSGPDHGRK